MITTLKLSSDFVMFLIVLASLPAFKMTHSKRAHTIILASVLVAMGTVASCAAVPYIN
jgi:hypothetical protein